MIPLERFQKELERQLNLYNIDVYVGELSSDLAAKILNYIQFLKENSEREKKWIKGEQNRYLVAVPYEESGFGYWAIAPAWFLYRESKIPDLKSHLKIPNMEEVQPHVFKSLDGSSGKEHLENFGIFVKE